MFRAILTSRAGVFRLIWSALWRGQNVDHLLNVEDAFLSSPNVGGKAFCINLSPELVRCLGMIRARACDRILNQSDAIRVALRYLAAALPDGGRAEPKVSYQDQRALAVADSAALRAQERRARSAADHASGGAAMLADAGQPAAADPDPLGVDVAPGPVCEAPGNAGDAL